MRNLTATLCLTFAVHLGSAGVSWSADFQKGLDAVRRGDTATAPREWNPLAEQGDVYGQYNLGWMYHHGKGAIQDYTLAHMWLNIAASQGNKNAIKGRDMVEKRMTPADISKAQRLARECVKKNYKGC